MNGIGPEHHTAEGENLHPAGGGKHPEVCFISTYVLKKKKGVTRSDLCFGMTVILERRIDWKKKRLEAERPM